MQMCCSVSCASLCIRQCVQLQVYGCGFVLSTAYTRMCVCQVGSSETSLASLTVSVAQSKLTIRSLVLAPVVQHVTAGTACPASPHFFRFAFHHNGRDAPLGDVLVLLPSDQLSHLVRELRY